MLRNGPSGYWLDESTQLWVKAAGRKYAADEVPWLIGPKGSLMRIGEDFYTDLAQAEGLTIVRDQKQEPKLEHSLGPRLGLMPSFAALQSPHFSPSAVADEVRDFYERTSAYRLDVWNQWSPLFQLGGSAIVNSFSKRLKQLTLPLSPLELAAGVQSEIIHLREPSGLTRYVVWLRTSKQTAHVFYLGMYSLCVPPRASVPCVKVVFPLPNGSATVILRPNAEAGALVLRSSGKGYGDAGFYFVVYSQDNATVWTRYLKSFKELIRVYVDAQGTLRTEHDFRVWGARALSLHYQITAL